MDTEGVVRAKYRALAGRLDEATLHQLATVALERDAFHGEWNYTIKPSSLSDSGVRNGC